VHRHEPAFIKGIAESLPNAAVTVDKFLAVKIINDAVDPVRRLEQKQQSLLRGIRYIGLGDLASLWERLRARLDSLPTRHLKIATRNLKAVVYLLVGKLGLRLPT
jgi:transposase